jgi:hypothetical protein
MDNAFAHVPMPLALVHRNDMEITDIHLYISICANAVESEICKQYLFVEGTAKLKYCFCCLALVCVRDKQPDCHN